MDTRACQNGTGSDVCQENNREGTSQGVGRVGAAVSDEMLSHGWEVAASGIWHTNLRVSNIPVLCPFRSSPGISHACSHGLLRVGTLQRRPG
eukprot:gene26288-biopygen15569